ncbi:hypothetical protein Tsubulata_011645 [Turnera subulata]|uniref:Glabrous enhancer-binding protein-like DBD domain-containing protein n=1 Tax=Turnera subulata TaxID=218843 RepID=A0A9Q0FAH2_9ROSI|nr:hypothetical protein Tsubulata_011645 [Turnera subulata]
MARKRELPLQISLPPAIPSEEEEEDEEENQVEENHSNSSSQEEEEEEEDEDEDEEEEEDEDEDEEEAEEDEDEEEEEEEVPNNASQATSSKSKAKAPLVAKSKAKAPSALTPPPPKQTIASKRGAQVEPPTTRKSKRPKKDEDVVPVEDDHKTKTNFMPVWTKPDEIILLKGLIRFQEGKQAYSNTKDAEEFLGSIKEALSFDVSVTQLKDKVSRLKKKYVHGKWKPSQNEHERQAYDFCHTIWGDSGNNSSLPSNGIASPMVGNRRKGKLQPEVDAKASGSGQVAEKDGWNGFFMAEMEGFVMKKALESTEGENKAQLEEASKQINVEGLRWFLKKLNFLKQQTKFVLESYLAE